MGLWYRTGDVSWVRGLSRRAVVCLDVETTGLDPRRDEVLQLAVVRGDGEVLVSQLLRPARVRAWPAAQRVHGIAPEAVRGCPTLGSIASEVTGELARADLVVGYNVAFDLSFLREAGIGAGRARVFDVMREHAPVEGRWNAARGSYSWVPLEACAARYGCHLRAHDALEDARATLRCFWEMVGRGAEGDAPSHGSAYLDVVARHSWRVGEKGTRDGDE
ncbi:3'-5' exonuclease [Thermophilibacter mediterraneus]|uniref:3'-5' exonuclease n=1 Tax=Thermophilibacter mediterraneus TaxID=1871031 RepID=UPI0009309180|nr:3'-5' exonuclease [Thermophilibacter mediterraneus]